MPYIDISVEEKLSFDDWIQFFLLYDTWYIALSFYNYYCNNTTSRIMQNLTNGRKYFNSLTSYFP